MADIEVVYCYNTLPDGERHRMKYSQFKRHYADCTPVPGTYDKDLKTIEVIVPEGRMKPSGVRGESFHGYEMFMADEAGKVFRACYRAVSEANAMKQHKRLCKLNGCVPCDPPEGRVARIYL